MDRRTIWLMEDYIPEAINIFNEASDEPAATFVNEKDYFQMQSALILACDRLASYAGCPRFGFEGSDGERAECQKGNEYYAAPPCSYSGCWYFELLDSVAMGHEEAERWKALIRPERQS